MKRRPEAWLCALKDMIEEAQELLVLWKSDGTPVAGVTDAELSHSVRAVRECMEAFRKADRRGWEE